MLINYLIKYYSANQEQGGGFVMDMANCDFYFMLYLDNELNASEKQIVEQFLQDNPDQKVIMEQMKNTIIPNENFSISKNLLYKHTNINENNIETLYLQYLDNELTQDVQEKVLNYLLLNPIIANELEAFNKTKLEPQSSSINKSLLYKTSNASLAGYNNFSEILVAYVDGETTNEQNAEIEKQLAEKEDLQQELALLKSVKLSTEAIIYPYKETLYKKEKKDTPIFPMWLRYSAAACFLAIASWFLWNSKTGSKGNVSDSPTENVAINKDNLLTTPENSTKENSTKSNNKMEIVTNLPINNFVSNLNSNKTKTVSNTVTPQNNNNVKKGLNTNSPVTNLAVERKTYIPDVIKNIVEQNKENNEEKSIASVETSKTLQNNLESNNATNSMALNTSYETLEIEEVTSNYTTTIMGMPTEKLVKKEKLKKSRLAHFIQNKIQNISNTSVSVGKYEIAFAK